MWRGGEKTKHKQDPCIFCRLAVRPGVGSAVGYFPSQNIARKARAEKRRRGCARGKKIRYLMCSEPGTVSTIEGSAVWTDLTGRPTLGNTSLPQSCGQVGVLVFEHSDKTTPVSKKALKLSSGRPWLRPYKAHMSKTKPLQDPAAIPLTEHGVNKQPQILLGVHCRDNKLLLLIRPLDAHVHTWIFLSAYFPELAKRGKQIAPQRWAAGNRLATYSHSSE